MGKINRKLLVCSLLLLGLIQGVSALASSGAATGGSSSSGRGTHQASEKHHKRQRPKVHSKDYMQGTASYYADEFTRRQMANGKPLDMSEYTAAHPWLPLGSKVKVTNLKNDKVIYVEITDRMPKKSGHVIDLTTMGAETLGFKERGLAKVTLTRITERAFAAALGVGNSESASSALADAMRSGSPSSQETEPEE